MRRRFSARHHAQGAHVVQAVGELDQDDADVAHHGQQHLAEIFRLRLGMGFEFDLGELADAVDQFGDFGAELAGELLLGRAGVFDHIMQDGRHDALVVHVHLGQDACATASG